MPDWARVKGAVPVHVTIKHEFDKLIFTAKHPNSENVTLACHLVNIEQAGRTTLYVVYRNVPEHRFGENAAEHKGCCELELHKPEEGKSATPAWRLSGIYWTEKRRNPQDENDKGTWGEYRSRYESRNFEKEGIDFEKQARFDI